MRRTIAFLLFLALVAWFMPPQLEDVSGQCSALETMVMREQAWRTPEGKDAAAPAAVALRVMQYARARHGGKPAGLGCAMVYWELVFDGDLSLFQADRG